MSETEDQFSLIPRSVKNRRRGKEPNSYQIFWTKPSADDVRPTDPLGLDAMREELADKLVPCLTGRTRSHKDFYWCLAFIRWSTSKLSEKDRVSRFLIYERWLKLCLADAGRTFAGSRRANAQASESGAPHKRYVPLLKNQRSQGLLGAHLQPLRKLNLIHPDFLQLTETGSRLVEGADAPILEQDLPDGAWDKWHARFERARRGYGPSFKNQLREALTLHMPLLPKALAKAGWCSDQAWSQTAHCLGSGLEPYARLAGEFIPWAGQVSAYFEALCAKRQPQPLTCPPPLRAPVPSDLKNWDPLRDALPSWKRNNVPALLARLHETIFRRRGYSDSDLWVQVHNGELVPRRPVDSNEPSAEGSDCRWSNAVALLRPR